ncbi:hypothetical protein CORC01_10765 [Colletotrichum orchidophilum]|uniref:Uncharacterized protein n=1 Tax=Colletotrichum orchidophilum TaxID=1209926 RepID=A0A1G4AXL9_9PEZI|nr:uncharacterized protein CORC01_10765 [Colletotrichum orchidophilum]OHE93866.1 hypothetical protein CORC01_10765 [Colletotrichum orchidophilum]
MAGGSSPKTEVEAREKKRAKDKVRKSGTSAQGKALQLGEFAGVFSAVVYYNPTYGWLDGAIHVPEGQDIPDVNAFFAQILNESPSNSPRHGPRRAKTCRQSPQDAQAGDNSVRDKMTAGTGRVEIDVAAEADVLQINGVDGNGPYRVGASPISHGGNSKVAKDNDTARQLHQRLADGPALRGTSRCAVKQEMPDGAVADDAGRVDASGGVWDIGTHGLFDSVVGNKMQNGQSGDVSEWETVSAQYTEAPMTRVAGPGLSRIQAVKVQRFLRQVSVHMRLASRQERLPPHRVVHQDRWRGLLQRNRRR